MTKFLIGGAVAALAMSAVAPAAQPAPPAPPGVAQGTAPAIPQPAPRAAPRMRVMFGGDHVMTRDEVSQHVARLFARLDANHDGYITREEADAIHARMEAAMARMGDVEKRLTERGVFIGDRGAMFDRLDKNHDNNISREEFMAGSGGHNERVMIMRGPDGSPGMPGMHAMGGMDGMRMHMHGMGMGMAGLTGRMFEIADANHDGRVSLAEAQAAALQHFDKADLNHDGKITPDERMQMHETIRFERRQS